MLITGRDHFVSIIRSFRESGSPPDAQTRQSLQEFVDKVPFYHQIDLIEGVKTPGFMTYEQSLVLKAVDRHVKPGDRVLDAGCRDGLFTLKAHQKGASEIVALDIEASEGFTDILAPIFDLGNVRYTIGNFLDPAVDLGDNLDVVILSGLLYHLRYPFLGIRRAVDALKEGGIMILETAYLEALADLPILLCPVGDYSPFEPTSVTFFNRRGLSDTLGSLGFKVTEVVDEFTFILGNKTRYGELSFPESEPSVPDGNKLMARMWRRLRGPVKREKSTDRQIRQRDPRDSNIGRLIWVCQKTSEPTVAWTHPSLSPKLVRSYWNLTATTHAKPMWLGKRGVKGSGEGE